VSDPRAAQSADLVARLLGRPGEELTCEECFEQLDRYVELEPSGREADVAVPDMRSHLEGCPACREDCDSLAALLGSEFARPHG
jgi:predicted anti-sigma-YlaC factor YlaD